MPAIKHAFSCVIKLLKRLTYLPIPSLIIYIILNLFYFTFLFTFFRFKDLITNTEMKRKESYLILCSYDTIESKHSLSLLTSICWKK